MPKPKRTDGMLCCDASGVYPITFFIGAKRRWILLEDGEWYMVTGCCFDWKIWSADQWEEMYDLAPPKPGKCFPCSVEL